MEGELTTVVAKLSSKEMNKVTDYWTEDKGDFYVRFELYPLPSLPHFTFIHLKVGF